MDCTQWWGPHFHWFWIFPLIFVILMVVFAAFMFRRMGHWRSSSGHRHDWGPFGGWGSETPRQILDRRYASGEITKEQYDEMNRDIGSGAS
jgi:putative membrane protein